MKLFQNPAGPPRGKHSKMMIISYQILWWFVTISAKVVVVLKPSRCPDQTAWVFRHHSPTTADRLLIVEGDATLVLHLLVVLVVHRITRGMCSQMRSASLVKDPARSNVGPKFFRCRWAHISQAFENVAARAFIAELDPGAPMLLQCL